MTNRLTAILQEQINRYLTGNASTPGDTCTIQRATGSPRTLTTIYSNEPCRVDDHNPGSDPGMAEINQVGTTKRLIVRAATTLKIDDQVIHNGHTYVIYSVSLDSTPNLSNSAYMHMATT